jgi:hypothetical protein
MDVTFAHLNGNKINFSNKQSRNASKIEQEHSDYKTQVKIMNRFLLLLFFFLLNYLTLCSQSIIESHMMGHSLMDHSSPTQETKIAYWIHELAVEAGHTYESTGQFGSIWDFANFNPISQWGSPGIPASWDSDVEAFGDASLNNFIYTVFNYIQDLPSNVPYYGSPSVLGSSERLADSVRHYQANLPIFLYENWPDMGPFTTDPFNPSPSEMANYHTYTLGAFHDWWLNLHDSLLLSRPSYQIRMIPVGPVLSELLTTAPYDTISPLDLYEDNAPHGRESIYFLAGLATYMAIYEERAPSSYSPPATIHPAIVNNLPDIIDDFWDYMIAFNDANGNNRVFNNPPANNDQDGDGVVDSLDNCIAVANPDQADYDNDGIGDLCDTLENRVTIDLGILYQKDAEGILLKGRDGNCYLLFMDSNGVLQSELRPCPSP